MPRLALTVFCLIGLVPSATVSAADWPQWMGPKRDDVWRESGLITTFPKQGLNILWRVPVGGGYAGPAVAGGRVFVTDFTPAAASPRPGNPFQRIAQPGAERVVCIDQATGKVIWEHTSDVAYTMSYSAGPRATPAVDGDRVYTLGGEGNLLCLDAASGKVVWEKKLSGQASPTPMWGFASHPLVDGPRLICLTGGTDPDHGSGVVTAFDKLTGQILWSALAAKEPGYSPPVIFQSASGPRLIAWDPDAVNCLDPQTGKLLWAQAFGPAQMGLTIVTPRFEHDPQLGDVLFVTTQYEGSMLLKLDEKSGGATVLWKRKGKNDRHTDALHTLLSTPSIHDGHIYGVDNYGELRCLDLKTGDRLWSTFDATTYDAGEQKWATAFLIRLGEHGDSYLIANEHGDLILAELTPSGYHETSRTHLLNPTNTDPGRPVLWVHPALANRCIFWRNDKEIICASMAASGSSSAQ